LLRKGKSKNEIEVGRSFGSSSNSPTYGNGGFVFS
jgi:hypothetical protein